MIDLNADISVAEQEICVSCGFCCDGTLFKRAVLEPGERGAYPVNWKTNTENSSKRNFLHYPVPAFAENAPHTIKNGRVYVGHFGVGC